MLSTTRCKNGVCKFNLRQGERNNNWIGNNWNWINKPVPARFFSVRASLIKSTVLGAKWVNPNSEVEFWTRMDIFLDTITSVSEMARSFLLVGMIATLLVSGTNVRFQINLKVAYVRHWNILVNWRLGTVLDHNCTAIRLKSGVECVHLGIHAVREQVWILLLSLMSWKSGFASFLPNYAPCQKNSQKRKNG